MKTKVAILFLAAALMATTLSGCGNSSTGSATSTESSGSTTDSSEATTDLSEASIDLITEWEEMATITLGGSITIDGEGAELSDNVILITEGGAYTITGSSDDVSVLIEAENEDVKIILDNANMTSTAGPVIYAYEADSLYVETAEGSENTLTDSSTYETDDEGNVIGDGPISSKCDLVLLGNGTLNLVGNYNHCVKASDSLYIEGGTYNLTANVTDGIHANDLIVVDAGTLNIDAASDMMESEVDFVINGGTITGTSNDEGLEAKSNLQINGGTINLSVEDDGLNAGSSLLITDGDITITATTGDAMDSNGSFEIDGGNIVAYGGSSPEGALDCDMQEILINGGTIIAVGDANSAISESSEQISVLLGQYSTGAVISIQSSDGTEVISFTLETAKTNIIVSTAGFTSGETYTVYVDGTEDQTFTADSQVISAGGSSDSMGGGMGGGGFGGGMGGGRGNFDGGNEDFGDMEDAPDMSEMPDDGEAPDMSEMPDAGDAPEDMGEAPDMSQMPGDNARSDTGTSNDL